MEPNYNANDLFEKMNELKKYLQDNEQDAMADYRYCKKTFPSDITCSSTKSDTPWRSNNDATMSEVLALMSSKYCEITKVINSIGRSNEILDEILFVGNASRIKNVGELLKFAACSFPVPVRAIANRDECDRTVYFIRRKYSRGNSLRSEELVRFRIDQDDDDIFLDLLKVVPLTNSCGIQ